MPDGIGISDRDLYNAEISVVEYLDELLNYLNRLTAFGAMTTEQANGWMISALRSLGYTSGADFEARSVNDNRVINMGEAEATEWGEAEAAGVEGMPGVFAKARKQRWAEHLAAKRPIEISTRTLPLFKQVTAPIVYRADAIRRATDYGYEEGGSQWNTLVNVTARKNAEAYQMSYIQEWLTYNEQVATAAGDTEKAERHAENLKKVVFFQAQQRQEQALREQAGLGAQQRAEAWEEQRQFAFPREPAVPTGEPALREFLEEERPAGLQEFIRGELPGVLERFEREQAGARRAWWGAIQRPDYEQSLAEAEQELQRWSTLRATGLKAGLKQKLEQLEIQKGAPLAAQDVMPDEWAFLQAGQRMTAASQRLQQLQAMTPEQMAGAYPQITEAQREDPLAAYLREYPWTQEFMKLAPSQRGFYPSRFAPAARWFT